MSKRLSALVLVLTVAVLGSLVAYHITQPQPTNKALKEKLERAADFLLSQYNSQLRLCSEAPNVAPNTYWLASDNLLAHHALEPYYPDISRQIYLELKRRDGFKSGVYEALFGESIPLPIKEKVTYIIEEGEDYVIKTDVHNLTTAYLHWDEYANLLICSALSLYWEGSETEAFRLFDKAVDMWDGKGLYDRATEDGLYETYKLALLLYVSRIFKRPLAFKAELENILWATQRESDGGIRTHYNGSVTPIVPTGDANTETTSLTLIAYTYSPDVKNVERSSQGPMSYKNMFLTSHLTIQTFFIVCMFSKRKTGNERLRYF